MGKQSTTWQKIKHAAVVAYDAWACFLIVMSWVLVAFVLTGCCGPRIADLTRFPQHPKLITYKEDPVLSFDDQDKTYVVTDELIANTVSMKVYYDAVVDWKQENNIK